MSVQCCTSLVSLTWLVNNSTKNVAEIDNTYQERELVPYKNTKYKS